MEPDDGPMALVDEAAFIVREHELPPMALPSVLDLLRTYREDPADPVVLAQEVKPWRYGVGRWARRLALIVGASSWVFLLALAAVHA